MSLSTSSLPNDMMDKVALLSQMVQDIEENVKECATQETLEKKKQYRIQILKKEMATMNHHLRQKYGPSLKDESPSAYKGMTDFRNYLIDLCDEAVYHTFPSVCYETSVVVRATKGKYHYQFNSSFNLAKRLQEAGDMTITSKVVGERVAAKLNQFSGVIDVAEATSAGFVNITLKREIMVHHLKAAARNLSNLKVHPQKNKPDVIVIDYSSPNIAKDMHVGHLRSTIIGDCLQRVLRFLGHEVRQVNHVGDWGLQFGMLIAYMEELYPDALVNPPPIQDLQSFYREAKAKVDSDENFAAKAQAAVAELQQGKRNRLDVWKLICEISRRNFNSIYERLNVTGLKEMGESFYNKLMITLVADLEKKNMLKEEDGRKLLYPSREVKGGEFVPLTMVKSNGAFTYDTSDMACIQHRANKMDASRIIYVVDEGQSLHLETIFQCAKDTGIINPDACTPIHVAFGVVCGEDGKKFKTRSGDTTRLSDLLDEAVARSRQAMVTRGRDQVLTPQELEEATLAIAYGGVKYADLKTERTKEYIFSFDRMLDDKGNNAMYMLYQLARVRSIRRNSGVSESSDQLVSQVTNWTLDENEATLLFTLLKFPEVLHEVELDLFPHVLCSFLYEIATVFSDFYNKCRIIETAGDGTNKVDLKRLLLVELAATQMGQLMDLLGIKTADKV